MKIAHICLDERAIWSRRKLDHLEDGLNVVLGRQGSGKTTLARLVRAAICGYRSRPQYDAVESTPRPSGALQVTSRLGRHIVRRDDDGTSTGRLTITGVDGGRADDTTLGTLTNGIDGDLLGDLLLPTLGESQKIVALLSQSWPRDLLVAEPHIATRPHNATRIAHDPHHIAAADGFAFENPSRQELLRHREAIVANLENHDARRCDRRTQLDASLQGVEKDIDTARRALSELLRQLRELESWTPDLDQGGPTDFGLADTVRQTIPFAGGPTDTGHDRLDVQIRRWEQILSNLDSESEALTPHYRPVQAAATNFAAASDARGCLTAMERLLEDLDAEVGRLNASNESCISASLDAYPRLMQVVQRLRRQVYVLCGALSRQNRITEPDVWSAELRQLDKCREAVQTYIQFLVQRRTFSTQVGNQVDRVEAAAIPAPDPGLCCCRRHAAFATEDLRRSSGARPLTDRPPERFLARKQELEREIEKLDVQRLELQRERRDLAGDMTEDRLRDELRAIDERLSREPQQRRFVFDQACHFLAAVTEGHLVGVQWNQNDNQLRIVDHAGGSFDISALSPGQRDQVVLSLHLALTAALRRQGIELPLLLDNPFAGLDAHAVRAAAAALLDFGRRGHQVLLLTDNESTVDWFRSKGIAVRYLSAYKNTYRKFGDRPARRQVPSESVREPGAPVRDSYVSESYVWDNQLPTHDPFEAAMDFSTVRHTGWLGRPLRHLFQTFERNESVNPRREIKPGLAAMSFLADRHKQILRDAGILDAEDLLAVDVDQLADRLGTHGIKPELLRAWQSRAALMCYVPNLLAHEAHVIAAVGILDPQKLANADADLLHERLREFLSRSPSHRHAGRSMRYNMERVRHWIATARQYAWRWQQSQTYYRWSQRFHRRSSKRNTAPERHTAARNRNLTAKPQRDARTDTKPPAAEIPAVRHTASAAPQANFVSSRDTETRDAIAGKIPSVPPRQPLEPTAAQRPQHTATDDAQDRRFYLELGSPVEDAPSIGPKTAERLAAIGIYSVADLLRADPQTAAEQLSYRRVKGDTIAQWQHQARLVCQIPRLRGHDAQILVACGFTDAEAVGQLSPDDLHAVVAPFVESKEGHRLIRSAKKPDFDEIRDWIAWARQTRPLAA